MLKRIATECSDFILETNGNSLEKVMLCNGKYFRKVKVRHKKKSDVFKTCFDYALKSKYKNILGRSVFCNGKHKDSKDENEEGFFVFPINEYKFLFNPNVEFHREFQETFIKLADEMSEEDAIKTFVDMVEYSYSNKYCINDATFTNKEIIIYNIPYYYAVKKSKVESYFDLLKQLKNHLT